MSNCALYIHNYESLYMISGDRTLSHNTVNLTAVNRFDQVYYSQHRLH